MTKLERLLTAAVVVLTVSTLLAQWAPPAQTQTTLSPTLIRTLETLARPYAGEQVAEFTRTYYTNLIEKGFSEEHALQIVVSMGAPSLTSDLE